ncbi:glycosyltransferase [Candidatus Saccharibacteria bacterium]|nr:glycosyltransferase [Candidatus Saccharibacteria bacterium]
MKIVIATAVYYPQINGVAVFSHNLAVGLAKRGNEVMVICPSQTGRNYTRVKDGVKVCYLKSVEAKIYPDQIHAVPDRKRFLGVKWPHLWYRHGFRVSVFPAKEVQRALDEFRPDVVHVQVSDPIGLSVVSYARKRKIPVVTTEHNQPEVITEPLKVPGVLKKPMNALLTAYFVNRQGKSDFVTMPTEKAIRDLIWSRGRDFKVPVAAVSNGVDLSQFRPGKVDKGFYRKYNLPENRPVVLYVGRVDPEKSVGSVVEAFKMVLEKIPEAVLVVVGDGVDKARLEQEAEKLGIGESVKFLGKIMPPDLYEMYRVGEVFVTASEIETQGIVLIEAAASGLPLVAVDAGAVSEVCRNDENGFLIEKDKIKNSEIVIKISEAVIMILENQKLRERFSVNSVKIAEEHDFKKTLDKFMNIYRKVILIRQD